MRNWKFYNGTVENEEGDEPKIISIEKIQSDNSPQDNKIYFYTDVSKDNILNLNKQIDELTKKMKMIQFTYDLSEPPPIEIHICSDGGEIFAANAAVDKIMSNSIPIYTFIEGVVTSAASLLSVCGHKRFMTKNSVILIHSVSSQLWGNYIAFKEEVQNLDLIMNILKNIYLKKTNFKSKELDELLKHDLYMDSTKCLKRRLVDYIL